MRTRSLFAGVCLAFVFVGCHAAAPVGGPLPPDTWRDGTGPKTNSGHAAHWYLDNVLVEVSKPGSGVTTSQQITILLRYSIRSTLMHEHIPRDASWARVHRAYRLALDKNWDGVIHALGTGVGEPPDPSDPTNVRITPVGWPNYTPATPMSTGHKIKDVFTQIQAEVAANGYSSTQITTIDTTHFGCTPSSAISADAAWVGFWEALEIARHPPSDSSGTITEPCAAGIICEVCPD